MTTPGHQGGAEPSFGLAPPQIIAPKEEAEQMLPIRREELRGYIARVEALGNMPPSESNLLFFFLGLAAALIIGAAGFAWATDTPKAGLIEVFLALGASSLVAAGLCHRHDKRIKKAYSNPLGQLVGELKALEARYPKGGD
jgi:hypothetical protein